MEKSKNANSAKISKMAIASLILSIIWAYGIGSILGITFGHRARAEIKKSNGKLTGDGLALAGLIIGYLTLIVTIGIILAVAIPKMMQYQ